MARVAAQAKPPRLEEQTRVRILAEAAEWFARGGYAATSMRDIAAAVGVTPGALYVHFPSKGQLLLAVYAEGVARIGAAVDAAIVARTSGGAWQKLAAAAEAHLSVLLDRAGFARVIVRVVPDDVPEVSAELRALRDGYEVRFAALIADLDLAPDVDARLLRLMLLGALNGTQQWAKPHGGHSTAAEIARQYVRALQRGAQVTTPASPIR
jgi:AcrR family transcriptional regulator